MKRIYTSPSLVDIGHLRNVLEHAGIACLIRNQELSGALGELPFLECWPELWVRDDAALKRAEALLAAERDSTATGPPWRCAECGADNEGQFAACWSCLAADA